MCRHDLILETGEKEDGYVSVGELDDCLVRGPFLMTPARNEFGRRHDGWDQLADGGESVLKDDSSNVSDILIGLDQLDSDGSSKTLAIDDDLGPAQLLMVAHIVEHSLAIDCESVLTRGTSRQAVAAVFGHEDMAAQTLGQHLAYGQSMTNIACIAVEGEECDVFSQCRVGWTEQVSMQGLAIGRGELERVGILNVKALWGGHIRPCARGQVGGIDDVVLLEVEQTAPKSRDARGRDDWYAKV